MAYDYYKNVREDMQSILRDNEELIKRVEENEDIDSVADDLRDLYTDAIRSRKAPFSPSEEEAEEYLTDGNEHVIREVLQAQYELIGLEAYLNLTPGIIDMLIRLYYAESDMFARSAIIFFFMERNKKEEHK